MFAICLQTKKFENKMTQKPYKIRKSRCKHFCKQYKVGIRANFFIYSNVNGGEIIMADVTVQKRGKVYQYKFEIASTDGKRKLKNKSGLASKSEAKQAGIIAYNGIDFLGFNHILTGSGKVIRKLRFSYKQRMRKHIKTIIKLKNKFIIDEEYINMRINSFKAYLKYSNEQCDKLLSNVK